jgi:hypothetical protein
MPRRGVDPALVETLKTLLAQAKAGRVRGLFIVAQLPHGEKFEDWITADADDLIFGVRTSLFRLEVDVEPRQPAPPEKDRSTC